MPSFSVARTLTSLSHWKEKKEEGGGGAPRSADQSLHPFLLSRETAAAVGRFNQDFSYGGKGGELGKYSSRTAEGGGLEGKVGEGHLGVD